jgi:predicted ester cyclase
MSTERNKALIRRLFEEGLNQNKPAVIDEVITPDFVIYDSPLGTVRGPQAFRQGIEEFRKSFPDLHVTFEAEYADGDYVFHRGYVSGTHTGEFQGIPPTGRQIKIKTLDIWHVVNGKAVENWVQMDLLGLMQQIGAVPTPEQSHI